MSQHHSTPLLLPLSHTTHPRTPAWRLSSCARQVINIRGDVLLRSHELVTTTGVRFVVHPGAHFTVRAPTIEMARTNVSARDTCDASINKREANCTDEPS